MTTARRRRRFKPLSRIWQYGRREGACLIWTGRTTSSGYGQISANGRPERVHRIAWSLSRGRPIPPGAMVTHRCDRRLCFAAACLELGSARTNAADAVARGRIRRGERHWAAKLTEADVIAIRAKRRAGGVLLRDLADELGVARTTLGAAARGASSRHVAAAVA